MYLLEGGQLEIRPHRCNRLSRSHLPASISLAMNMNLDSGSSDCAPWENTAAGCV